MNQEQIEERIKEILADTRLKYKSANVFTNAPLALIQVALSTELHTLQRVLGVPLTNISKLRGE